MGKTILDAVRQSCSGSGNLQFEGEWPALLESGLVPNEWQIPPPPITSGVRWVNADGRHCKLGRFLTKDHPPRYLYRVSVFGTYAERAERVKQKEEAERKLIEARLHGAVADGLSVKHYPPRFSRYVGSRKQLLVAGVLPAGTEFPAPRTEQGAVTPWERWSVGKTSYWLKGRYRSGSDRDAKRWDGDHWELTVFDDRHTLSDNIVEIWNQELQAAR